MVKSCPYYFSVCSCGYRYVEIGKSFPSCFSVCRFVYTGHSRYVDFVYLDTTTYVEVIFHSQHFFFIFLCISTPSMSKKVNMKQLDHKVICHALDIFSIIFATVYVEVKIGAHMSIVCFGYVHV